MRSKYIFVLLAFIFSLFSIVSCDLLRYSLFEVISWSPGSGYFADPQQIVVSLNFSNEPNRASVERNFSLTSDGNRIRGNFYWEGRKLIFSPLVQLEENKDYIISLSAEAYDSDGLNMDYPFYNSFTTRPDNIRPELLSFLPEMYAQVSEQRTEVQLLFSAPVTLQTLYDNVSFTPSMTGFWRLEDNGRLAILTPSEPWRQNSRYEIRVSSSLTGTSGINTGQDFLSIFTTQTDYEVPILLSASRITADGSLILLLGAEENRDWEKQDKFLLVFSKPIDSITLKNYLSIEDGPNIAMESVPGINTEFIFRLEGIPAYESRFTLRIRAGIKDVSGNESKEEHIFKIFANGRFSKPPALAGLRMPMSPGNGNDLNLVSFGADSLFNIIPISDENYPSGESIRTWIELYFNTAEDSAIEPFSLMELFRVETSNNVISFSPRQIKTGDFTVTEPQIGWENYQRIEIAGFLINQTNFGIINFLVSPGLRDSLGNVQDKQLRISLIK
ncbi:MAG: Ig-like domain-containing protein [Treponema sp.]|nr:Ig-like domain-containing protein [Treponema sp.]